MEIAKDRVVSIQFRLTTDEGELLDESAADEPLVYLHGAPGVLPKLQDELAGKSIDDEFAVTITPEEGFGDYQPGMIREVPRSAVPAGQELAVGMPVSANDGEHGVRQFVITSFNDDTVTLDGNHPLAGKTVTFAGTVADVRAATDDELNHGHPL